MQFTKSQVLSLFIAVLMVGSILGIITYTQPGGSNNQPPAQTTPPTALSYSASGVSAKVLEVFPTAVLLAKTSEFSAAAVEAKIKQIPGVVSVSNGQFASAGTANFRADMRLSQSADVGEVKAAISRIDTISEAEVFPQALIFVDGNVELSNSSLGLTQNYTFKNSQSQAYVSASTMKGDEITVSVQAEYSGQVISNILVVEEDNTQTASQVYFTTNNYTIASLENEFFVRATDEFSRRPSLEALQGALLKEDSNAQVQILPISNVAKINFANASGIFEQDLNTFLSGSTGVESFTISLGEKSASITLAGDLNSYLGTVSDVNSGLEEFGWKASSIEMPKLSLQVKMKAAISKEKFLEDVSSASHRLSVESEVLQKATIDTNSIFISDSNKTLPLHAGFFTAFVNPAHSTGDSVTLSLFVAGSERGGVDQIQAQEEQ